eukprot:4246430-Pleurochrysis_carterae.AAC.2
MVAPLVFSDDSDDDRPPPPPQQKQAKQRAPQPHQQSSNASAFGAAKGNASAGNSKTPTTMPSASNVRGRKRPATQLTPDIMSAYADANGDEEDGDCSQEGSQEWTDIATTLTNLIQQQAQMNSCKVLSACRSST